MKKLSIVLCLAVFANTIFAQISSNDVSGQTGVTTITTAVPFLRIAPDARAASMGDIGLATAPDANSTHWNPAKLPFAQSDLGLSISYTPWLRALVPDIYLANLTGYKKLDENQSIGASLMYFSLGSIAFTDIRGESLGEFRPNEFKTDVSYARKLSDNLSTAVALRYIYSNLATGQKVDGSTITPGQSVAADVAMFYTKPMEVSDYDADLAFGLNISNIGSKISYTKNSQKDFIPTNLGLGSAFTLKPDAFNKFTLAADINKLLVPTPSTIDEDGEPGPDYKALSPAAGMFTSFSDASGGTVTLADGTERTYSKGGEEMAEFIWSLGAEYWYADQFAVRAGYFHESVIKGNRQFYTVGFGLKLNVFSMDVSYLIPANTQKNPLENTLRFSMIFNLDDLGGGTKEGADL